MTSPGDFSSGDVLTAADMNGLPAGLVAGGNFASTDPYVGTSASTVASFTFTTSTDRKYLITANTFMYDGTTNQFAVMQIDRGSTTLQQTQGIMSIYAGGRHSLTAHSVFTGTGTNDTFTVDCWVNTGNAYVSRITTRPVVFCLFDVGAV